MQVFLLAPHLLNIGLEPEGVPQSLCTHLLGSDLGFQGATVLPHPTFSARLGFPGTPRAGDRDSGSLTPPSCCARSTIRNAQSIHQRSRKRLSQDAYRRNSVRFLQQHRRPARPGPQSAVGTKSECRKGAGPGRDQLINPIPSPNSRRTRPNGVGWMARYCQLRAGRQSH